MFSVALSTQLVAIAISAASYAAAQGTGTAAAPPAQSTFPDVPLALKRFEYDALPYKVDTDVGLIRGNQYGYNICNSTTEGQTSLCQNNHFSSIDDFCLWGPPEYGEEVGNIEGIMVAYCTKPGHGTRLIPEGALKGVQFTRTPDYVQAVGFIDQTFVNILEGDWGGEMDPHGADLRGNPMGGLVFSTAFGGARPRQVIEWHNFVGGNFFCFKACDPDGPDAAHYCEHIFDRIGCDYNAPNNAVEGVFESCQGDNQDFPGTYTGADGQRTTYTQPEGPITAIPYTARVPASSSCTQYTSSALYTGLPKVRSPAAASSSAAPTASTTGTPKAAGSTPAKSSASVTGTAAGAGASDTSGASQTMVMSGLAIAGVVFSAVFFG